MALVPAECQECHVGTTYALPQRKDRVNMILEESDRKASDWSLKWSAREASQGFRSLGLLLSNVSGSLSLDLVQVDMAWKFSSEALSPLPFLLPPPSPGLPPSLSSSPLSLLSSKPPPSWGCLEDWPEPVTEPSLLLFDQGSQPWPLSSVPLSHQEGQEN
uniref:Uncharacterized protein n=1 Tax=Moniliophthora roreri TaxID=221103 RepID=A0A0W0FB16_MONRR